MVVRRIARPVERSCRPLRRGAQHRQRVGNAEILVQVDQAAHELVPVVEPHARIAVGGHGLPPALEQRDRLVAQRGIAGRAAKPHKAAQQLPEDDRTGGGAPAAHRDARRRQAGLPAEAVQDVIVGNPTIELPRMVHLRAEPPGQQADMLVVEGFQTGFAQDRRVHVSHHWAVNVAAWDGITTDSVCAPS